MTLRPCSLKEACAFVAQFHRHHDPPQGHKFSMKALEGEHVVGVAIVGRPVGRHQDDGDTLELTRLCTDGTPNACSFLIGRVKRAARALGYKRLISYTLASEGGAAWRASNMVEDGTTSGGAWSGTYGSKDVLPGFEKVRKNTHPLQFKVRWSVNLMLAVVIAGVTVLPVSDPPPRCDRAHQRRLSVTAPTVDDAVYALTAQVRALGGDTLKLTRTAVRPGSGLAEGFGFSCGVQDAD